MLPFFVIFSERTVLEDVLQLPDVKSTQTIHLQSNLYPSNPGLQTSVQKSVQLDTSIHATTKSKKYLKSSQSISEKCTEKSSKSGWAPRTRGRPPGQPTQGKVKNKKLKMSTPKTPGKRSKNNIIIIRELHSPLVEKPLEVVRPLPFQIAKDLHKKGFPKVCVKFASIVPTRKEEVEAVMIEKCSKRKYRRRDKSEKGDQFVKEERNSEKRRKAEEKTRRKEEKMRLKEEKGRLKAENIRIRSERAGLKAEKSGLRLERVDPKVEINSLKAELNGLKTENNGLMADWLEMSSEHVRINSGKDDGSLLDSLIPAKLNYGGKNNPFHLGNFSNFNY